MEKAKRIFYASFFAFTVLFFIFIAIINGSLGRHSIAIMYSFMGLINAFCFIFEVSKIIEIRKIIQQAKQKEIPESIKLLRRKKEEKERLEREIQEDKEKKVQLEHEIEELSDEISIQDLKSATDNN